MRWKIREGAELVSHTWDGEEFLVYDASTGDTHLINAVTLEALRLLQRSAQDSTELGRSMAESLGADYDPELGNRVESLLIRLDRIGLADPAS